MTPQLAVVLAVVGLAAIAFVIPRRRTWKPAIVIVLVLLLAWALGAV